MSLLASVCIAATLITGPAACDHPEPFVPQPAPTAAPRTGNPRRITFSPEADGWPAWRPDGTGIGYSFQPTGRSDRDRCLGFLPPMGGTQYDPVCVRGGAEDESTNAVTTHAMSAGGRLALVAESGNPRLLFPAYRALYAGRIDAPLTRIRPFPYLTASGRLHLSAAAMVWPDDSTLVYLAAWYSYRVPTPAVPADTEYTGIELVQLALRGDSVVSQSIIPGTLGATSLAPGSADTVYFTMGGDSRVFWLATRSGLTGTLYDFGGLGIVRDAQVAAGRLVAVVGGRVRSYFNNVWGIPAQADSGGPVYAVQLPAGGPVEIVGIAGDERPGTLTYRHLALDPTGRHFAAEVSSIVVRRLPTFTDTIVSKQADLWLFDLP